MTTVELLTPQQVAALDDDALVAYTASLTDVVEAAPTARDARLIAWNDARGRVPPIAFAKLATASRMSTSGVINSIRAKTEKDHAEGRHKRKAVPECHPCRAAAES